MQQEIIEAKSLAVKEGGLCTDLGNKSELSQ